MTQIDFYFDLASPNSYMARKAMPDLLERTGASVRYIPILLGGIFKSTGNQAPWITYAPIENKMKYQMTEIDRFVKRHKLDKFQMNSNFPMNTLLAQRAMVAAEINGDLEKYMDVTQKMMWEDGVKMDDPEALAAGLAAGGFDAAALLAQTQDPEVKAKLASNTEEAVQKGCFGVPSFVVNDELYFGKDKLIEIEWVLNN